ncbi:MAG: hypothetical protein LWX83_02080 [Anaerolineae bacterium]|nr:hypothetical protein [Anaerolineae bacterium]
MTYYEIVIKGHLDDRRKHLFQGLDLTRLPGGETLLAGELADQAALFGVLIQIRDLGLPLLSLRRRDQKPA